MILAHGLNANVLFVAKLIADEPTNYTDFISTSSCDNLYAYRFRVSFCENFTKVSLDGRHLPKTWFWPTVWTRTSFLSLNWLRMNRLITLISYATQVTIIYTHTDFTSHFVRNSQKWVRTGDIYQKLMILAHGLNANVIFVAKFIADEPTNYTDLLRPSRCDIYPYFKDFPYFRG